MAPLTAFSSHSMVLPFKPCFSLLVSAERAQPLVPSGARAVTVGIPPAPGQIICVMADS